MVASGWRRLRGRAATLLLCCQNPVARAQTQPWAGATAADAAATLGLVESARVGLGSLDAAEEVEVATLCALGVEHQARAGRRRATCAR